MVRGAGVCAEWGVATSMRPVEQTPGPWVRTERRETGLIEHVCKCGVGHPAAGSITWLKLHAVEGAGVHGCCGCCKSPEWVLADLRAGLLIANKLLMQEVQRTRKLAALLRDEKERHNERMQNPDQAG